jgi:hypothetical protein
VVSERSGPVVLIPSFVVQCGRFRWSDEPPGYREIPINASRSWVPWRLALTVLLLGFDLELEDLAVVQRAVARWYVLD